MSTEFDDGGERDEFGLDEPEANADLEDKLDDALRLNAPTLGLARVATDVDERVANLIRAFATEPGEAADTARWALESLSTARAALVAIREAVEEGGYTAGELLEIVGEGLETATEDDGGSR